MASTSDGTASAAEGDYTPRNLVLILFSEGERFKTFRVPVLPDMRDETNETVIVTLSAPGDAVIADPTGVGTIIEDDDHRPTAILAGVPEQRDTPIASTRLLFIEEVMGLDLSDLGLSRDGGPNLLTAAQRLTGAENNSVILGNLSGITAPPGHYVLTLSGDASTSFITDIEYNPLVAGGATAWTVLPPDPDDQISEAIPAGNGALTGSISSGIDVDLYAVRRPGRQHGDVRRRPPDRFARLLPAGVRPVGGAARRQRRQRGAGPRIQRVRVVHQLHVPRRRHLLRRRRTSTPTPV